MGHMRRLLCCFVNKCIVITHIDLSLPPSPLILQCSLLTPLCIFKKGYVSHTEEDE